MTDIDYDAIWDAFLERWPVEAVRAMTLEEYTNTSKTSFTYWVEFQTQKLASIGGGNALKAGIYQRAGESEPKLKNAGSDDTYVWSSKYGSTAEEAFQTIKARLLRVIEAAKAGDLEAIEKIDVGWNMFKWKVAFFYQDRENPKILPVFSKKFLFNHYKKIAPGQKLANTAHSLMYPTLWEKYQDKGDLFDIGVYVASTQETGGTQYWLVPLHKVMSEEEARTLASLEKVQDEPTDALIQLLNQPDISAGDRLALLFNREVLSTCKVTAIEPEFVNWETTSHAKTDYHTVLHKVELADDADRGLVWLGTKQSTKVPDSPSPEKVSTPARGPQPDPTAVILYGPPGTGKTWSTMTRALHLLYDPAEVEKWSEEVRTKHFRAAQDQGHIAFVTFHQAYGYEEFVEGIRPVMDEDSADEVRYEVHSGVFKRLALRAATAGLSDESEDSVLARSRRV